MLTEKDNHIIPEEAKEHEDDRVAVTSQDVALINSDQQALVNAKEKSTKEKVIAKIYTHICYIYFSTGQCYCLRTYLAIAIIPPTTDFSPNNCVNHTRIHFKISLSN